MVDVNGLSQMLGFYPHEPLRMISVWVHTSFLGLEKDCII